MKLDDLVYQYNAQPQQKAAYLLLHGVSEGIESSFMQSIYQSLAARGEAVLAFNWPYFAAGTQPQDELAEELRALQTAIDFLRNEGYEEIRVVAKSLGGIVLSRWLVQHPDEANITVGILGYVIGQVDTTALAGRLRVVVQGENDKFGDADAVQKELANHGVEATVIAIANADHSYRDAAGEPAYQQQAVAELLQHI